MGQNSLYERHLELRFISNDQFRSIQPRFTVPGVLPEAFHRFSLQLYVPRLR